MKRTYIFDLSGVLINRSIDKTLWTIEKETIEYLNKLKYEGNNIFISTGRYFDISLEIFDNLKQVDGIFSIENGLFFNGELTKMNFNDKKSFLLHIKEKYNHPVWAFGDGLIDIDFLKSADRSFVPTNSHKKLREYCASSGKCEIYTTIKDYL